VAPGTLTFVRVHAGADRKTRVERQELVLSSEPTPGLFIQKAETFAIRVIAPGARFDWHVPSRRRMVAPLRGTAIMTLRDGSTYRVTPGMVLLVENVDSDGHRGSFDETEYTITMDVGLPVGS
jgi:quercetin dioxygenase-like cupin family protein